MIQKTFLGVFNKYFLGEEGQQHFLTAFFCSNPTFPPLFTGNIILKNRKPGVIGKPVFRDYAMCYASEGMDGERF